MNLIILYYDGYACCCCCFIVLTLLPSYYIVSYLFIIENWLVFIAPPPLAAVGDTMDLAAKADLSISVLLLIFISVCTGGFFYYYFCDSFDAKYFLSLWGMLCVYILLANFIISSKNIMKMHIDTTMNTPKLQL